MSAHPDLARLRTALAEDERLPILAHLRDCATCRATLSTEEPSALFSLLALRVPDPERLEAVSRDVEARLPAAPRSLLDALRERGLPRLLPLAAAAAVAGALLLVGLPGTPVREPVASIAFDASRARADVRVTDTAGPAQVVDLTVGDTQVVMIFASEIDL